MFSLRSQPATLVERLAGGGDELGELAVRDAHVDAHPGGGHLAVAVGQVEQHAREAGRHLVEREALEPHAADADAPRERAEHAQGDGRLGDQQRLEVGDRAAQHRAALERVDALATGGVVERQPADDVAGVDERDGDRAAVRADPRHAGGACGHEVRAAPRILGADELLAALVRPGREDRREGAETLGRHALEQRQAAEDVRQVSGRHRNLMIGIRHAYLPVRAVQSGKGLTASPWIVRDVALLRDPEYRG